MKNLKDKLKIPEICKLFFFNIRDAIIIIIIQF